MSSSELAADQARRDLYEVMRSDTDFETKAQRALDLGRRHLGVDNAHLTRIDQAANYWEAVASTDPRDGDFPPGLVLDFERTYCRHVLGGEGSLALHDAPEQGWNGDPAFEEHGLHCYHGTPLRVDGEPYGTVCFVSETPRDEPFDEEDTLFAELVARLLEHELERREHEAETTRRANSITVLSRVLRHNLRNEMTVVRGRLSALAEAFPDATQLDETLFDSVDRIIDISDKARKLESVVSTEYDRDMVAMEPLLDRIETAATLDHPEATVTVDVPSDLAVEVMPSFELAVTELLENAVTHAGPGARVDIEVEGTPGGVWLQVSDDGPGLPPQEQAVLSEGVETPLVHGSGLGLWMVYWIVTSHDGTIVAETGDGGTTITVTIPRTTADDDVGETVRSLDRGFDRFEAVFEESFDAMVVVDDDRRIIDANDHAADLFDQPKRELFGRSISEFSVEAFDSDAVWTALTGEGRYEGQVTIERPDGAERVIEFSAAADIVPGQHLFVGRDITERIERQRELERTNQRLDAIFNNTYTFVGTLDPDGTLREANETALAFGGVERSAVVGEPFWETDWWATGEETRRRVRELVDRASEGEFVRERLRAMGADGEVTVDFSLRPVTDDDGEVTMLIPEGRVITEDEQ